MAEDERRQWADLALGCGRWKMWSGGWTRTDRYIKRAHDRRSAP